MGTPESTSSMRTIMHKVDDIMLKMDYELGPIVVHCSAGIGRTGTFIAIHIIISQLKEHLKKRKDDFDFQIFNTVKTLKHQRVGMIQKKVRNQYQKYLIFLGTICILLHHNTRRS